MGGVALPGGSSAADLTFSPDRADRLKVAAWRGRRSEARKLSMLGEEVESRLRV